MKIYDLKVSKGLSVSTAALLSVVIYLILTVALNLGQNVLDPTGESYDSIYGIIQFVVATFYWLIVDFIFFSRKGRTGPGAIVLYLFLNMLPIVCFTLATSVIVQLYPTTDFMISWNLLTWLVAPTMFWYLPFSYVYYAFGYYLTVPIYMAIILVYVMCVQCVGIILGLARAAFVSEKEGAIKRQRERIRQAQHASSTAFDTATVEAIRAADLSQRVDAQAAQKLYTGTNPFREPVAENEKILYTEAFEVITEDSIKEYEKKQQESQKRVQGTHTRRGMETFSFSQEAPKGYGTGPTPTPPQPRNVNVAPSQDHKEAFDAFDGFDHYDQYELQDPFEMNFNPFGQDSPEEGQSDPQDPKEGQE